MFRSHRRFRNFTQSQANSSTAAQAARAARRAEIQTATGSGAAPDMITPGSGPQGRNPPPQLEQERQDWDRKAQCLSQSSFHRMPLLFHWIVREVLLQDLL